MTKHHSSGLFRQRPRNWAKDFVATCRALGMTDAEIKAAMGLKQTKLVPETQAEARQQAADDIESEND